MVPVALGGFFVGYFSILLVVGFSRSLVLLSLICAIPRHFSRVSFREDAKHARNRRGLRLAKTRLSLSQTRNAAVRVGITHSF